MSKLIYLFLIVIVLLQSCKKEEQKSFTILGEIDGIKKGKAILSKLDLTTNERVDVDSTTIKDGKFTFIGKVKNPYVHTIFINGNKQKIHLFLENSKISISGNKTKLEQVKITGSREDSLFRSYKLDDIFDRKKGMEIMIKYPDYSFAAFTAYYQFQIHNIAADTLATIMNNFTKPVQKTVYYQHLNTLYQTIKNVAISQSAPLFSIPNMQGKKVFLSEFRGKYVLLDFWASWCAPCRAENPKLVEVYNRFDDEKFTIIGISVDKSKKNWLQAIENDKLPWTQVSNLKGWDVVSGIYGVKAVPQNFLLDRNGIIIDKNITPENLLKKLESLLK